MNKQLNNLFGTNSPNNIFKNKSESSQIVQSDYLDDAPITPRMPAEGISSQDEIQDIDYARRTLQFTIERSQQLVEMSLANAADGSSPRDIEVASNALNTCANLAEKLVELHTKISSSKKNDFGVGNTFVNNNKTIVLTSSELLKQLSEDEDNEAIDV